MSRRLPVRSLPALLVASGLGLACGVAPVPAPVVRRADAPPDVVLVTLDTTRADHLGPYGHTRSTSPVLERLAAESLTFERAVSTSSWTLPAHASLFTGRLPSAHGAHYDPHGPLVLGAGLPDQDVPPYRVSTLADDEPTLAGRLAGAGYDTFGVAGGPWLKRVFGLAAGFQAWDDSHVSSWRGAVGPDVTDAALSLLAGVGERPFFLFVNYFDPHSPYSPPWLDRLRVLDDPFALLKGGLWLAVRRNGYEGEIRRMDRELGRLLAALRALGRYADSLIIVTADHGELFGEAGHFGHGSHLSEAELHVPLLVKLPGGARAGERVATRVSTAGVFGLTLEQAGLHPPSDALPSVLAPLPGPVLAETYPLPEASPEGAWRAIYVGSLKYLWNSEGNDALRDLSNGWDPDQNLLDRSPELGRRMEDLLLASLPEAPRRDEHPMPRAVDAETREALRNLGYLR